MLEGGCVTSERMASWVDVAGWFCLKFSVPRWSPKKGEEKTALSGEASRDPTGSSTLGWLPSWLERKGQFRPDSGGAGQPIRYTRASQSEPFCGRAQWAAHVAMVSLK